MCLRLCVLSSFVFLSLFGIKLGPTILFLLAVFVLRCVACRLRSHGGLSEGTVPLLVNRPLTHEFARRLTRGQARNLHLFDFLLNGLASNSQQHSVDKK